MVRRVRSKNLQYIQVTSIKLSWPKKVLSSLTKEKFSNRIFIQGGTIFTVNIVTYPGIFRNILYIY